ncbi:MAG: hypothetical protein E7384_04100 [Ruminococcaceae bacterium]|nr:hypothetical protein [Oscillospiraceae bacterium]
MQDVLEESLKKSKRVRVRKTWMISILLVLSLVVSLDVFWSLRQPGWTLAGDADCKILEHTHDDGCQNGEIPCELEEHVHCIECYSDENADVESQLDWQKMFSDYPFTGNLREDLVGIAKTQVGYSESTLNFEVGSDGIRRGYTRYGAWYGAPYMDWSAAFVSYCLNYAGADSEETPGNTGASSMAEVWNKLNKYFPADDYKPVAGDLVFFENNTVGIVTDVHNATFYVIRGDVNNAVCSYAVPLKDASVIGWGLTCGTADEANRPSVDYLLNISDGPAVFIFEGSEVPKQIQPKMRFSLKSSRPVIDLTSYLESNGGSYFFTLLDQNNQEVPKDADGNYIAQSDTDYKLTISFTSPEGFVPGTYQYRISNGVTVNGGDGRFILKDGTDVGSWTVSDDGLITLDFNDHINSRIDITISATMGIKFPEQDEPIDFDGKIIVKIEKPDVEKIPTKLNKWGVQGNAETSGKTDSTKIYWTALVEGQRDSKIPGSVLTDKIVSGEWLGDHRYTESDMAGGLTFGVSEPDPVTGQAVNWHRWVVYPGDPNLTWNEDGWSYKFPETAFCQWCGEVTLGSNNWSYTVEYTSTPIQSAIAGAMGYMNKVEIENQYADGWAEFTQGELHGDVIKHGSFISDASGGSFRWELQATIPGMREGQKSDYFWYIMDYMDVRDYELKLYDYVTNDVDKSVVTAEQNGVTIKVPSIHDATAADPYAWHNYWSVDHGDGIYYGRQLNLLCRCHCNEANCQYWNNGRCESEYWFEGKDGYWYTNGYCQCWTATENTIFTFAYETDDISIIERYGGMENSLRNEAVLYNKPNAYDGVVVASTNAHVPIPGLFKKELTHDFNGYTANYKITVNEGKLSLTDGTPLTIHDVMTQTLVYISGSLVITAEDANGHRTTLKQDVDYTVTYDGTGNATDEHGKPVHILDIEILHPQPVMYILDYDTTLMIPTGTTQAIKYSNSAEITLWGEKIKDPGVEKVYADINIAAKNYKVELFKTCALTGKALRGATFGLFNENGGLIATDVTDANGALSFQSNIVEGIILREHVLYYVQELKAPPGYILDGTKHWFCFCDERGDTCSKYAGIISDTGALRIPFEQVGKINVENQIMDYDLPATGGPGTYPLILTSVIFIITPFVYRFIRRRKREGRGVG